MENIEIIASEKHYIAVYKPAGILSQSAEGRTDGKDMVSLLSSLLGRAVFPVHRLDRETAGVMLYATDKVGASKLSMLIAAGELHKTYLAVCEGALTDNAGELHDLLYFDRKKNKSYVADKIRSGVKEAALYYETLEKTDIDGKTCTLIRVKLYTGRTHQIRVQFASRKHPLVGDARYGSHSKMPLALFSHRIEFCDPFDGKPVSFVTLPTEQGTPFALFPRACGTPSV